MRMDLSWDDGEVIINEEQVKKIICQFYQVHPQRAVLTVKDL